MAQACATFGFNPNIVPSPSQRNLRSQQASSTQGSSGSISQRTSDSTTSSVRSAWDVLIVSPPYSIESSNNALIIPTRLNASPKTSSTGTWNASVSSATPCASGP